jgi:hypothetical protein
MRDYAVQARQLYAYFSSKLNLFGEILSPDCFAWNDTERNFLLNATHGRSGGNAERRVRVDFFQKPKTVYDFLMNGSEARATRLRSDFCDLDRRNVFCAISPRYDGHTR